MRRLIGRPGQTLWLWLWVVGGLFRPRPLPAVCALARLPAARLACSRSPARAHAANTRLLRRASQLYSLLAFLVVVCASERASERASEARHLTSAGLTARRAS